ncbi:hypothetical protein [Streptomyces sp. LaPpAH-108]|uniref:hypothetical protein n=1 Tax=Streptomyces sp. LaPpAH-108 TaxID=1155714 RepID=UPI00036CC471|nr:hypothetical protein [Streptomyces sp. LaPpAH-108]
MASSLSTTVIAICGTLLGSGLTAWAAALAERRRNEALERQQMREEAARERDRRRELRAEHQKWRRDRRQAAYQDLMDAAHEAQGAVWQLGRLVLEPFDQHRYDVRRGVAIDAVRATRRAADAVQLEGPEDVAQVAEEYARAVDRHIGPPIEALTGRGQGAPSETRIEGYRSAAAETEALVEACRQRFVPLARRALDELVEGVE